MQADHAARSQFKERAFAFRAGSVQRGCEGDNDWGSVFCKIVSITLMCKEENLTFAASPNRTPAVTPHPFAGDRQPHAVKCRLRLNMSNPRRTRLDFNSSRPDILDLMATWDSFSTKS